MLLISTRPSTASSCVLGVLALLRPLTWRHMVVPSLPPNMAAHITAPQPYILGVTPTAVAAIAAQFGPSGIGPVLCVDLDSGVLALGGGAPPLLDLASPTVRHVECHIPQSAKQVLGTSSHLFSAAKRFAAAHAGDAGARQLASSLASALPVRASPDSPPAMSTQVQLKALPTGPHQAALFTLRRQWDAAIAAAVAGVGLLASGAGTTQRALKLSSAAQAHQHLAHMMFAVSPSGAQAAAAATLPSVAGGADSDLLGLGAGAPTKSAGPAADAGEEPVDASSLGHVWSPCSPLGIGRHPPTLAALTPLVSPAVQAALRGARGAASSGSAGVSDEAGQGSGRSAGAASAADYDTGASLMAFGRRLKHTIASSSLGQAVGREVRSAWGGAKTLPPSAQWGMHPALQTAGGETPGERLGRELDEAFSRRDAGLALAVHAAVTAFLALLLSSSHSHVKVVPAPTQRSGSGSGGGGAVSVLEWDKEAFVDGIGDPVSLSLLREARHSQMLQEHALAMWLAVRGEAPQGIDNPTAHARLHATGHMLIDAGVKVSLSALLSARELICDPLWLTALGVTRRPESGGWDCDVPACTFGDIRRRSQAALAQQLVSDRRSAMRDMLLGLSCMAVSSGSAGGLGQAGSPGATCTSADLLCTVVRTLAFFTRVLEPLGLRDVLFTAEEWLVGAGISDLSAHDLLDMLPQSAGTPGQVTGTEKDWHPLVDVLLSATQSSAGALSLPPRQLHQLVAALSHHPHALDAVLGVIAYRVSDLASGGLQGSGQHVGPTPAEVRKGAVAFPLPALQWKLEAWPSAALAANLWLAMLTHGSPRVVPATARLAPLLTALLTPTLGSVTAAAGLVASLGSAADTAQVAAFAALASARAGTFRSLTTKVPPELMAMKQESWGSPDSLGGGPGVLLRGYGSAPRAAWGGEPAFAGGDVRRDRAGAMPDSLAKLAHSTAQDDPHARLEAAALNVQHAMGVGGADGLGCLPWCRSDLARLSPVQGQRLVRRQMQAILRLGQGGAAWYRARVTAQALHPLLPGPTCLPAVSGAPERSPPPCLPRGWCSLAAAYSPAPLPLLQEPRGARPGAGWDAAFALRRADSVPAKQVEKLPLGMWQVLPIPPATSTHAAPSGQVPQPSSAFAKLHAAITPTGWRHSAQVPAMQRSIASTPSHVLSVLHREPAATVAETSAKDAFVRLQAVGRGVGGASGGHVPALLDSQGGPAQRSGRTAPAPASTPAPRLEASLSGGSEGSPSPTASGEDDWAVFAAASASAEPGDDQWGSADMSAF